MAGKEDFLAAVASWEGASAPSTVDHVLQRQSWDCGIAALEMVLRACGREARWGESKEAFPGEKPPWTIDLAYLLHESAPDLNFAFTTAQACAPEEHKDLDFYAAQFSDDSARVNELFGGAKERGVAVFAPVQLSDGEFLSLCRREDLLMVALVDADLLRPGGAAAEGRYTGHYVVVHGYDEGASRVLYHDPSDTAPRSAALEAFQRARCARGTDEDLIVVKRPAMAGPEGGREEEAHARDARPPSMSICTGIMGIFGFRPRVVVDEA